MTTGMIGEKTGTRARGSGRPERYPHGQQHGQQRAGTADGRDGGAGHRSGATTAVRGGAVTGQRPSATRAVRAGAVTGQRSGGTPVGRAGAATGRGYAGTGDSQGHDGTAARPRLVAARPRTRPRTPFILLLLGLLGGGLICLLLINTTLAEGSFQITALQQKNAALAQREQELQEQTAQEESPSSIAAQAERLGMRPVGRLRFINLKNGRIYDQPATDPGVLVVPGYTP
jgi:hypothetical protein